MFKIEMGEKVKDEITGFVGIITGRCDYISGCRQYCVTAKSVKNTKAESVWFDEDRLINGKTKNPGGPQFTPLAK